jgi:hypothetical protein
MGGKTSKAAKLLGVRSVYQSTNVDLNPPLWWRTRLGSTDPVKKGLENSKHA